jgi:hypothetical protein
MVAAFLGPFDPLPALPPIAHLSPIGGGAPTLLGFVMQRQQQDFWCWAATTASVSAFFDSSSPWTQCLVASHSLGRSSCCVAPGPCDVPFTLDQPLNHTNNLDSTLATNDSLSNVQSEIDAGRPVCCHILWNDGSGHFVALTGYDPSTDDVVVDDPLYGSDTMPYDEFAFRYHGGLGRWDFTYFTKS